MARTTLTEQEYQWILDAVNDLVGPRPTKAEGRSDSKANAQRYAWGHVHGWTERKLRRYDFPATKEQIYQIARRFAEGVKG